MTPQRRVLLVDDELAVRQNLRAYLEDEGYLVDAAASAEEGKKLLDAAIGDDTGMPDYHAVIVDMRLPGMGGEEFIRQSSRCYPTLKFLIHTGSLEYLPSVDLLALGVGEQSVIYKPLPDLSELSARLEQL
ncbi:response regulator [Pseudomaricurvus alkylphenolicus]|jgi:DNA-binding response OmpR family regulator|uniref:response regulator n=1 Tax=Pseudomaricurvus alkylphenolicus TaxID=1306991 RepID=UPI00141D7E67|nr:response regulator [Pseudomaricurvus alkylphenolicus]NIB43030.1 response regulator [Pseudomaricurvus alkylphenolicus]